MLIYARKTERHVASKIGAQIRGENQFVKFNLRELTLEYDIRSWSTYNLMGRF
jgi:hypothetical protein